MFAPSTPCNTAWPFALFCPRALFLSNFPEPATPDVQWIPIVADPVWVILTQDRAIRRHPHERNAVLAANARYFGVAGGSRRGSETAAMLVNELPSIERVARTFEPPTIARVTLSGVHVFDPVADSWTAIRTRRCVER